ncbi:MAG: hypothetical protein V2I37_00340 [Marinilabiliaceae bacterium]|jgi:hypothetical protein|nr:hypothetical protein [Marinilabiliaceae bacterium]
MDFKLLYRRIVQLITRPVIFWSLVKDEQRSIRDVRRSVVFPVLFLIAIASFIGTYRYTYNTLSVVYPLLKAVEYFLIFFLTIELVSILLNEISGFMVRTRLNDLNYKLIVYSLLPFMLLMVMTKLFSSLLFFNLLGFYGMYLLWRGVDILIGGEYSFRVRFFILFSSCILVFYLGIRWIIIELTEGFYLFIFA